MGLCIKFPGHMILPMWHRPLGQDPVSFSMTVTHRLMDRMEKERFSSPWRHGKPWENHRKMMENGGLPSGKHTKSYWKWPFIVDFHWIFIYVAVSWNGYGSITVHTIFRGWTSINPSYFDVNYRGTRFWHTAKWWYPKTMGFNAEMNWFWMKTMGFNAEVN